MFVSKENKKYKNFIKQFKKLKDYKKLRLISFIIFNYSEDFFISKKTNDDLLNNVELDNVTQNISAIYALDEKMANKIKKMKSLELMNYNNFPNILDAKYAIKNE